jgi:superfamily II DNA helicase RecQ
MDIHSNITNIIPNIIKRVINFGVPENMEDYVQAIGRGDRDGSNVVGIMYYRSYHLARCDPTMRTFVKNKTSCRHDEVVKNFGEKSKKPSILHQCCDICSEKCDCGSCRKEIFRETL